jgi:hypothetical protein
VHGDGFPLAVASDPDLRERGRGGDLGQGREPVSLRPGPSLLPGPPRRQAAERGVDAEPCRPGHAVRELVQLLAGVGGSAVPLMFRPGSCCASRVTMRRASHSREADIVSLTTRSAITGTAAGRRIIGSRTQTASTTQLFPDLP